MDVTISLIALCNFRAYCAYSRQFVYGQIPIVFALANLVSLQYEPTTRPTLSAYVESTIDTLKHRPNTNVSDCNMPTLARLDPKAGWSDTSASWSALQTIGSDDEVALRYVRPFCAFHIL